MRAPYQLVLDTNTALDLMIFNDPVIEPLRTLLSSHGAVLHASTHTLNEFARVLSYPRLQLDADTITATRHRYAALCQLHRDPDANPTLPQCADPDDQAFIELAAAIPADFLLSKDKAVLHLGRQRYRDRLGFQICAPAKFFAQLPLQA
ncbi:MAG: putative toxin-antitoxin system toxin component, PIN family [Burkholderiaceae bacterium]|nr:MAG: putative toxin-antitoxin system toxin component, PIN family [Burkholderiaceae bacterium]